MNGRRSMKVPEALWERLKRKAEREGRTIMEVLGELIDQIPDFDEVTTPEERACVFCGKPARGKRICDDCFYDPLIVRPQIVGLIYYNWAMENSPEGLEPPPTFEKFIPVFTYDYAILAGLSDEEWEIYQEWLRWREKFLKGEMSKDDPAWKKFCVQTVKGSHVGIRAGMVLSRLMGSNNKEKP